MQELKPPQGIFVSVVLNLEGCVSWCLGVLVVQKLFG